MTAVAITDRAEPPVVSVIIPSYNHARYVVEAVTSVINQTCEDWELIIVDDGSTDATLPLLAAQAQIAADPRIRIHAQANGGSHAAINRGLSMARGRYLAILNSDDRYAPTRLETLVRKAADHGEEVFIVTGLRPVDAQGAVLPEGHWWFRMYADILQRWSLGNAEGRAWNDFTALLWGNFTVTTSNFFVSRTLWQRLGPLRPFRYVLDWEYALRVAFESPGAFCYLHDATLLDYRLHGANTILGGALRNHAEAYHMLRSYHRRASRRALPLTLDAVDRLYYLSRFIRHEHARQQLERQQVGWLEQVAALRDALDTVRQSFSWRLTAPLRVATRRLRQLLRIVSGWSSSFNGGWRGRARAGQAAYDRWLAAESISLDAQRQQVAARLRALPPRPVISVLMPVHNTPAPMLRAAVESVRAQWYPEWELCICDDASCHADTLAELDALLAADTRIKRVRREHSGHIVRATNDALSLARGDFICFLDHDDLLAPQALLRMVECHGASPEIDLFYSDEDKLDARGRRCLPLFKPDWSEVLLWSQNYVGHLMCVRRRLLIELGGLTIGSEGSQDHDLVLRLAAGSARVQHIPEILYHWRMHPDSTAAGTGAKPYAHAAGREAVARHLANRYPDRFKAMDDAEHAFVYHPRFRLPEACKASIIIPTRDRADLLQGCIDSIRARTSGAVGYEIIVLDNGSCEAATQAYFAALQSDPRIRIVPAHQPFNWSALNNLGRRQASGQLLVFLNNDTQVISPDWLQRLAEYALLPDVGAVGPLLLYPDATVQHAGVVVGMGGWADHVFKGMPVTHFSSPYLSVSVPRNVLAVTGACLAMARAQFDWLGGFDEGFEICGSDVELCLRAHRAGLNNVYLPTVRLYHLESKTRSSHVPEGDFRQSAAKYAPYREQGDPFYNRNLDIMSPLPVPRFVPVDDGKASV